MGAVRLDLDKISDRMRALPLFELLLPQLLNETYGQIPRDATIVAILPMVSEEAAIALGNLKRHGFAVSVILNQWDEWEFAKSSGPLLAEGIETRQLKEETSISTICRDYVLH